MFKVYVSGPYTKGDTCVNVHNAIMVGNKLLDAGFIPIVPHLSHFWHTMTPRPYEDWLKIDLALVPVCDIFLRLPGESLGADREMALAKKLLKPIFTDVDELIQAMSGGIFTYA